MQRSDSEANIGAVEMQPNTRTSVGRGGPSKDSCKGEREKLEPCAPGDRPSSRSRGIPSLSGFGGTVGRGRRGRLEEGNRFQKVRRGRQDRRKKKLDGAPARQEKS